MNESTTPGAADQSLDEDTVAELVKRADRAAKANINGDHRLYFSLFDHPDDYTLMPPNGGPTWHGFGLTDADIEEGGTFFAAGDAALEVEQIYVAGNLVVLVAIERQHGEVGGAPEQDWSLRLTLVFRRSGDRWAIVHRHADPLVREISMEHLARLARGVNPPDGG